MNSIYGDCNYKIQGFSPTPNKTIEKWNFAIGLNKDFARAVFERQLTKDSFERLNELAKRNLKNIGLNGPIGSHFFEFERSEKGLTFLLHSCNVPGNATYLSLEGIRLPEGFKVENEYDKYLIFNPHNIDTIHQASALLSNWLIWYTCAEALIS
jgi:hypothetical protein